jgi:hypothetical protein
VGWSGNRKGAELTDLSCELLFYKPTIIEDVMCVQGDSFAIRCYMLQSCIDTLRSCLVLDIAQSLIVSLGFFPMILNYLIQNILFIFRFVFDIENLLLGLGLPDPF